MTHTTHGTRARPFPLCWADQCDRGAGAFTPDLPLTRRLSLSSSGGNSPGVLRGVGGFLTG